MRVEKRLHGFPFGVGCCLFQLQFQFVSRKRRPFSLTHPIVRSTVLSVSRKPVPCYLLLTRIARGGLTILISTASVRPSFLSSLPSFFLPFFLPFFLSPLPPCVSALHRPPPENASRWDGCIDRSDVDRISFTTHTRTRPTRTSSSERGRRRWGFFISFTKATD